MLILDFSDDFLDQVFDRDEAIGAGKFVEHDGEMHPLGPHIRQHVQGIAGLRDIERLTHQHGPVFRRRLALGQKREDVLDVHHADHIVELPPIDGHARMTMLGKGGDNLIPTRIGIDRNDFAAWYSDIVSVMLGKMKQIAEHLSLDT